jgi:hypothetical protein
VGAFVTEGTGPTSDDELLKQLEEELKTLKVSDLLVQTLLHRLLARVPPALRAGP